MKMRTKSTNLGMFVCVFWVFIYFYMAEVHIASLNVNGARDYRKRAELYEIIKQKKIDVTLIQETHSDVNNVNDWIKEWEGLSFFSHNTTLSGGVAILFAKTFNPISYQVEEFVKGRLLKVKAQVENYNFVFICVYVPNSTIERMCFLDALCSVLQNVSNDDYLFLGGDFNCTVSNCDRNHIEPHMPSRKRLIQIINKHELSDVWRFFHEDKKQYTWAHARDNVLSLARLDRFYVFKHHAGIFKNCCIFPVGFSDHCMVQCSFILNSVKPKSAYWHFNLTLLDNKEFIRTFKLFWGDYRTKKASFQSLQKWWDFGKVQIKQYCQQYAQNSTKALNQSMKDLETDIIKIQELAESTKQQSYLKILSKRKNQLAELLGVKTQGALVRSRFVSLDQMDAPSKFFFSLERKNGQKRIIHALRSEEGILLSNPVAIRRRAIGFYEKLYRSELRSDDINESVFFKDLPKVSDEANAGISGALNLGELHKAVQSMESGRVPGIDGIPVDFYKCFWEEIGEDLLEVLNGSLDEGLLPLSCRRAVLTLLPKKGDLTDIKKLETCFTSV